MGFSSLIVDCSTYGWADPRFDMTAYCSSCWDFLLPWNNMKLS